MWISRTLVAVALVVASANCADATLILRVDNGSTTGVTIHDGETGDLSATVDEISLLNPSGDPFSLLAITASSTPVSVLPPGYAVGVQSSVTITSAIAQTVRIIIEQTGFSTSYNGLIADVDGSLSGAGNTISFATYANGSNLVPGLGANDDTWGALAAVSSLPPGGSTFLSLGGPFGPGLLDASASTPFTPAGPFSIFRVTTITFASPGTATFTFNAGISTPEPASLSLVGTGLLGLGLFGFRRRQRSADRAVSA